MYISVKCTSSQLKHLKHGLTGAQTTLNVDVPRYQNLPRFDMKLYSIFTHSTHLLKSIKFGFQILALVHYTCFQSSTLSFAFYLFKSVMSCANNLQ